MTGCYSLGLSHYSRFLHRHRGPAGVVLAVVVGAVDLAGGDDMTYDLATLTRPERVRNIVDPPLLPDEMSQRNAELRAKRREKWRDCNARCRTSTPFCSRAFVNCTATVETEV